MIGHLIRAYEAGRMDARQGTRQLSTNWTSTRWAAYAQGWADERARMEQSGLLPQLSLLPALEVAPQSRLDMRRG
jgi:hypothetical protein